MRVPADAYRRHRRHEIVTVGGVEAVRRVGDVARDCGRPVGDFAVDVRDGTPYSVVTCTVSATAPEADAFALGLGALAEVVSITPR